MLSHLQLQFERELLGLDDFRGHDTAETESITPLAVCREIVAAAGLALPMVAELYEFGDTEEM